MGSMKTLAHKNLFNGKWAITQKGVVVGYARALTLVNVDVKEDSKKAAATRAGAKRSVHLWVRGTLVQVEGFESFKGRSLEISGLLVPSPTRRATYNPTRGDAGFLVDGQVWSGGDACTLSDAMYV